MSSVRVLVGTRLCSEDWDTSAEAMARPGPNPLPPLVQEERAG
jgi:hypothetical protein